jgi:hypothetical protein
MRTIIDVLKKGNLELFHSSMLCWLLDESAEHNLGRAFLDGFADILYEKGFPDLRGALGESSPTGITTEFAGREGRTDIELRFAGGIRFVIENKTKSIGTLEQLSRYAQMKAKVIALGFVEACFPLGTAYTYPLVTYGEHLNAAEQSAIREPPKRPLENSDRGLPRFSVAGSFNPRPHSPACGAYCNAAARTSDRRCRADTYLSDE